MTDTIAKRCPNGYHKDENGNCVDSNGAIYQGKQEQPKQEKPKQETPKQDSSMQEQISGIWEHSISVMSSSPRGKYDYEYVFYTGKNKEKKFYKIKYPKGKNSLKYGVLEDLTEEDMDSLRRKYSHSTPGFKNEENAKAWRDALKTTKSMKKSKSISKRSALLSRLSSILKEIEGTNEEILLDEAIGRQAIYDFRDMIAVTNKAMDWYDEEEREYNASTKKMKKSYLNEVDANLMNMHNASLGILRGIEGMQSDLDRNFKDAKSMFDSENYLSMSLIHNEMKYIREQMDILDFNGSQLEYLADTYVNEDGMINTSTKKSKVNKSTIDFHEGMTLREFFEKNHNPNQQSIMGFDLYSVDLDGRQVATNYTGVKEEYLDYVVESYNFEDMIDFVMLTINIKPNGTGNEFIDMVDKMRNTRRFKL